MLLKFANKFATDPRTAEVLLDTPATWTALLDSPIVVETRQQRDAIAPALCGARYFDWATDRKKEGIDGQTCLVLDVDCEGVAERVPNERELRTSLKGIRAIVYSSASHTLAKPRWRILVPLRPLLPPKKHRALVQWFSDHLVPSCPGCIDVDATGDPTRLGFVGVTMNPHDYTWFET